MKILVVCQYYYPEPFRIASVCEELVQRGHEVHVVTGYPNYPEGIIYDGYGKGKHIDEVVEGVYVHRCYTYPRQTGTLKRCINYYSFAFSSMNFVRSKKCVASDGKPFDIVFCNQLSPIMMAKAAIVYKKKYKVPALLYCLDLWPESLTAGGISRKSLIYKYYHYVSKKIYRKMDSILVTSHMFSDYLIDEFGIDEGRLEHLPQYAEGVFEQLPRKEENGVFDFMFAGNIGRIQSVDTIVKAADILKTESVRFHIVGNGTDLDRIRKSAEKLDNIVFYGRMPIEKMSELYAKADAMLVTLSANPSLSLTLPGKVQSYMAVGKPIIGAIDGETRMVIEDSKCGFCGEAEDAAELANNIKRFIVSKDKAIMGLNARKYYENNFGKQLFMDRLEKRFNKVQVHESFDD